MTEGKEMSEEVVVEDQVRSGENLDQIRSPGEYSTTE